MIFKSILIRCVYKHASNKTKLNLSYSFWLFYASGISHMNSPNQAIAEVSKHLIRQVFYILIILPNNSTCHAKIGARDQTDPNRCCSTNVSSPTLG